MEITDYKAWLSCDVENWWLSTKKRIIVYHANKTLVEILVPSSTVKDGFLEVHVSGEENGKLLIDGLAKESILVPKQLVRRYLPNPVYPEARA